eukprot:25998_6
MLPAGKWQHDTVWFRTLLRHALVQCAVSYIAPSKQFMLRDPAQLSHFFSRHRVLDSKGRACSCESATYSIFS